MAAQPVFNADTGAFEYPGGGLPPALPPRRRPMAPPPIASTPGAVWDMPVPSPEEGDPYGLAFGTPGGQGAPAMGQGEVEVPPPAPDGSFQNPFSRQGPGLSFAMHAQAPGGPEVAPSFSEMQQGPAPEYGDHLGELPSPQGQPPAVNPRFGSGPLGAPSMAPPPGGPAGAAASGGGAPFGGADEYEFVDASGNVVYSGRLQGLTNPNSVEAQKMSQALAPLGEDAQHVAQIAEKLQGLMSSEDAIKTAVAIYEQEKNRGNRLAIAETMERGKDARFGRRGGGGPNPDGGLSPKEQNTTFTQVNQIASRVSRDFDPKASNKNRNDLNEILKLIESPRAFDQRAAIGAKIKSISGAAATDQERKFYMGGTGFWDRMQTLANDFSAAGKLSPGLINGLRQHALSLLQQEEQKRNRALSAARSALDTVPGLRRDSNERKVYEKAFQDYYTGASDVVPGSSDGAPAPAPSGGAPDDGGDPEAEELLRQKGY